MGAHDVIAPSSAELDLLRPDAVEAAIRNIRPSLVIHAAGKVGGIAANQADQSEFLRANLVMGVTLVNAAAAGGVPRFLNIASSCIYPREAVNPLRETDLFSGRLEPTNEGYAMAKLVVLRLGEFLAAERPGFRCVSMIPCNLYGRWDHFEADRSHMVAAVIRKLHDAKLRDAKTVEIWGDGSARREFMLAADLAEFAGKAIGNFDRLPPRINVGMGRDHTVTEYYAAAAAVVGYEGDFVHNMTRPVGVRQKLVDTSVQESIGWAPRTSLEEGLEETYRFFLEHVA